MTLTNKAIPLSILLSCAIFRIASSAKEITTPATSPNESFKQDINRLLATHHLPGAVIIVRKDNKIILHQAFGYADIETKEPMTKDRLFRLYSMTKPMTALTTLQVLEEQGVPLNSPLQKIFPQFEQLEDIPLSTVMTHTSGFSYGFKINRWAGWLYLFSGISDSKTFTEFIDHLAELPLLSPPGERWRYSFSSDVQGAIVEKLTNKKLSENMHDRIFNKLDMNDTSFYVAPNQANRLAPMYSSTWFSSTPKKVEDNAVTQIQGAESGGGGLVSTALDYSKFLQALMTPKFYPDIVSGEHATLLTTNQLPTDIREIPARYYTNSGYSYGMGIKLKDEDYLNKGSFYWAGKGGTVFWADPKNALSVVIMMQYEGGNKIINKEVIPMVYNWLKESENTTH